MASTSLSVWTMSAAPHRIRCCVLSNLRLPLRRSEHLFQGRMNRITPEAPILNERGHDFTSGFIAHRASKPFNCNCGIFAFCCGRPFSSDPRRLLRVHARKNIPSHLKAFLGCAGSSEHFLKQWNHSRISELVASLCHLAVTPGHRFIDEYGHQCPRSSPAFKRRSTVTAKAPCPSRSEADSSPGRQRFIRSDRLGKRQRKRQICRIGRRAHVGVRRLERRHSTPDDSSCGPFLFCSEAKSIHSISNRTSLTD